MAQRADAAQKKSQDDDPPAKVQITKGPRVESVTEDEAVIAWSTNVNAGTVVHFGEQRDQLTGHADEPWGGLTHRVRLRGLRPATTYYFQAESPQGQGTGTSALSGVETFTTHDNSHN